MTSRPDTTGSEDTRLPRPPGPPEDPAPPEANGRTSGDLPADVQEVGEAAADAASSGSTDPAAPAADEAVAGVEPVEEPAQKAVEEPPEKPIEEPSPELPAEPTREAAEAATPEPSPQPGPEQPAGEPVDERGDQGEEPGEAVDEGGNRGEEPGEGDEEAHDASASLLPREVQGGPAPASRTVARGRLSRAMRPRATRAQLLAGLLCALLGFALVVQARQTQTQGLDQLRQADLVRVLDNLTNAEARAELDIRSQQAIRDRLLSGSDSSQAAQQAAQQRLDTLGLLAGTVPASGPGIELEITDPRRQIDASVLLDTLEELRDGGAEVIQIGDVRVVAATAFTDDADGVRVDGRLLTPPYRYRVIGDPQTLAKVVQIPGGVLDVLRSKGAQGRVTQASALRVDALRGATTPQYARPAPGGTP